MAVRETEQLGIPDWLLPRLHDPQGGNLTVPVGGLADWSEGATEAPQLIGTSKVALAGQNIDSEVSILLVVRVRGLGIAYPAL